MELIFKMKILYNYCGMSHLSNGWKSPKILPETLLNGHI